MFNKLTFQTKIIILVTIGVLMSSLLALVGYVGISKLDQSVKEQAQSAILLRNIDLSDMMHDAIKADVLAALVSGYNQENDPKVKEEISESFLEHDKTFRQQMANLSSISLEANEQSLLKQTLVDVNNYLSAADNIIKIAAQNHLAVDQHYPAFAKQFSVLEVSLEKLGDILADRIKATEVRAEQAGEFGYRLLTTVALIGIAFLIALSLVISRTVFRQLGGDPADALTSVKKMAEGDFSWRFSRKDDQSSLLSELGRLSQKLREFDTDMLALQEKHDLGDIEATIDTAPYQGGYRKMAENVNHLVTSQLNKEKLVVDCFKAFGEGDLDANFASGSKENFVSQAIEQVRGNLKGLIAAMDHMSEQHHLGDIDVMIDSKQFPGAYRKMAQGINDMVAGHINVKKKAMDCVKAFGEGNFEAPLEQFPGKKAFINEIIEEVRTNLKSLIEDAYWLASQAQEGNLSARADANRHQGDFRKIISGINFTLDAIIHPIQETIVQIKNYSHGDMSGQLTAEYKGDFGDLKKRLNYLAMTMKGVIDSAAYVKSEHDQGNTDVEIAADRFKGDFGTMARNMNALVKSHIDLNTTAMGCVKEFGEGNFEAPLERFPGKKAFINDTIEEVRANLKALIADTNMLSEAALDGRIQTRADANRHRGDFRKIIEGINATLETIVTPIITVKTAVDSISTAAKEISAGNSDLSHRTEQQAASLEETASSMEELASTVKQNADNARQANQMAMSASDVAAKGGSVVQQVVDTMYSINESARKIVDIISVIDGIALQTNILALNAAVEAARAGEQGRGFAVVASEVRNLAQRSAAAAKEIKGLIGDSVEKVEDGSKLVGEAGKTMDEIVTSVKRVTDIMTDIAAASEQQSSGIEQVNMAITQMDEVTQQNAALVEEAAAAAESLEEQAETLAQTVSQFRLNSDIRSPIKTQGSSVVPIKSALKVVSSQAKPSRQQNDEWEEF